MAYNILYKRSVAKDISRLDKRDAKRILDKIEKDLKSHPEQYPSLKGEFEGLRKLRIGDFRIIYSVIDNDVTVLRIGNRRDVYR